MNQETTGKGAIMNKTIEMIKQKGPIAIAKAVATVDGKVAASGELTVAIG